MLWPAGPAAQSIATIAWVLLIGGALIFTGVMVLLVRALGRGAPPASLRPALWIVGGGLLFPLVLLSALLAWSIARSAHLAELAPPGAMVVGVSGHMWWWKVRYRDPESGSEIVLANELRLPVGRSVVLSLSSADVIHSLWVPALAGKVDMVPGRIHHLVLNASQAGVFRAPCAEFCGQQHARMTLHVVAQPADEFDRWLAHQALPAALPQTPLQARGQQAFIDLRCGVCHTVRGLSVGDAMAAPDLTHVGSRLYLGAGTLRNNREALIAWMTDLQHLKPGARMASFNQLDAPILLALAAYLDHLK